MREWIIKAQNAINAIGAVITFLALAGLGESFTGHGSTFWSIVWLVIGIAMVLVGYMK